jgi:hypothetical protein
MDPSVQEPCMEDTGVGVELGGDNQPKTLCEDDVTHESHRSMVSPSALGDVDEGNILTDDNSDHLDVVGQRLLAWHDLEDRLLVTEDQITQVLTRTDGAHRFIEDLMWRAQMEERHSGVASGVTSAQLCLINDALEQLKSDYLQLFMDRDLVLKFVEDKEREVEELHYQLSVALSSPLTTGTPSSLAVMTQEGMSVTHDVREEPLMMSLDEEHSELQVLEESLDCTLIWHCRGQEPFLLESSLEVRV